MNGNQGGKTMEPIGAQDAAHEDATVDVEQIVREIRAELGAALDPAATGAGGAVDQRACADDAGSDVDIEAIMREIRAEVQAEQTQDPYVSEIMRQAREEADRARRADVPSMDDLVGNDAYLDGAASRAERRDAVERAYQQTVNEMNYLRSNAEMPFYWDMGKGIKGLAKRAMRRVSRFMLFPILQRQSDFNYHTASGMDALRAGMEIQRSQIDALENDALEALRQRIEQLETDIKQLEADSRESAAHVKAHEQRMDGMDRTIDDISLSISRAVRDCLAADRGAVQPAKVRRADADPHSNGEEARTEQDNTYVALDYFKFQNDFRGTQNQIMERQRVYLPYFRGRSGKVFDLGCGRGEFLRLLKEENIPAFGVDTYPEYEITGRLYDVDIRAGDGIERLEKVEEPLGGIFCAQVIEHLGFRTVEKLCRLAHDKLEDGAYLVLETPNPMCVSTMTNGFYIDPTHDKPVHPLLMEYLLKTIGFTEVQLLWPDHSLGTLPPIQSDSIDNLDEVNRAIERVSGLLYGSQDYAVVARK